MERRRGLGEVRRFDGSLRCEMGKVDSESGVKIVGPLVDSLPGEAFAECNEASGLSLVMQAGHGKDGAQSLKRCGQ